MIPISLNRNLCRNLDETTTREWLITNNIGAYASGTVAGMLTRMEHGLFVTRTSDSQIPQLLLAKIDEEVVFDQRTYYLGTNEYRDGTLNPSGFVHLETFRLDEGFPIFTYRLGGIDGMMLEKRIWMQAGRNSTYIQYRLVRTTTEEAPGRRRSGITGALSHATNSTPDEQQTLTLTLLPFTTYRPYDKSSRSNHEWQFHVRQLRQQGQLPASGHDKDDAGDHEVYLPALPAGVAGCTIHAYDGATPYHLLAIGQLESHVTFLPTNLWYWNFQHRYDAAYGRPALDDLYLPGVIRATLYPGEDVSLTIIVSTEEITSQPFTPQQLHRSYQRSVEGQQQILSGALTSQRYFGEGGEAARAHSFMPTNLSPDDETYLRYLLQAGERFLSHLQLPGKAEVSTVAGEYGAFVMLSDYYRMQRNTRDLLIALPGLLLNRNHTRDIAQMLRDIARHFKYGLLPDTIPLAGQEAAEDDYRSIDLPLWYCYALDAYMQATHDDALLADVYRTLTESVQRYIRGTIHGIHVDERDGLLTSIDALTWMNAISDDGPVTPRTGKAVEVNALWYHALSLMSEWSQYLYHNGRINYHDSPSIAYRELLERCCASFNRRFWHSIEDEGQAFAEGYLFDVLDGPSGDDDAIRPNQLFAFSLRYPVLAKERRASVLDIVTRYLLTPNGLRTLAPHDARYQGRIAAYRQEQALHQGSVWTWLLGPYIDAVGNVGSHQLDPYMTATLREQGSKQRNGHQQVYLVRRGLQILNMQQETLSRGLLGMCGSVFNGDAPFTPGDIAASLLATTELLRAYNKLLVMQAEATVPYKVASR